MAKQKGKAAPATKAEFQAYEDVRSCGAYNMMAEARYAADAAGLDIGRYMNVLKTYDECASKWPEVVSNG